MPFGPGSIGKMVDFPKRLFIAGTDTGVGKTFVSAILLAGLKGYYWKPIQSGTVEGSDTLWIQEKTGAPERFFFPEAYRLKGVLSPHAAAALENVQIDFSAFQIPDPGPSSHLLIEGAGGLLVPLNDRYLLLDLIRKLRVPVLLVVRSGLGTINHSLLSLDKLKMEGVDVFGVVMNGPKDDENRKAIEHFGNTRVLAQIEPMEEVNAETLEKAFRKYFG